METALFRTQDTCPDSLWQHTPVVIALVGGGGKTALTFWLARRARAQGHKVLVTTTTRMFKPRADQVDCCVIEPDTETLFQTLASLGNTPGIIYACREDFAATGKVTGFDVSEVDRLRQTGLFSVLIVEADGARQRPIKAPAWHEPCIPSEADVVLGVTGGEVVLQPLQPSQVHRWEQFSAITGARQGALLDQSVLGRLLDHPQGLFKGVQAGVRKIWVINKHDRLARPEAAHALAKQVLAGAPAVAEVWMTSMRDNAVIQQWTRSSNDYQGTMR